MHVCQLKPALFFSVVVRVGQCALVRVTLRATMHRVRRAVRWEGCVFALRIATVLRVESCEALPRIEVWQGKTEILWTMVEEKTTPAFPTPP